MATDKLFYRYDPQRRHVIHPWADFDELDTHHYPAYLTGVGRFTNGYKVFMPTEFMHVCTTRDMEPDWRISGRDIRHTLCLPEVFYGHIAMKLYAGQTVMAFWTVKIIMRLTVL